MPKKHGRNKNWTSTYKIVDGLEFKVTRVPKQEKEQRQIPKTLTLLGRVLTRFEYRGTWEVRFIKPTQKKGELFRAVKRDNNQIYCRVKLGDVENMWEIVLVPATGYVASEVHSNLLAVDPRRLFVNEAPQTAQEAPKINGDRHPQPVEPTPEITPEAVPEPPVVPEPVVAEELAEFKPHSFLRLDPTLPQSFKDTEIKDEVIDRALVVCAFLADPRNKAARRRDAICAISRELDLDAFVKEQGGYQDGEKVARSIIMALCNKSLMGRHKSNGSATSTHYMLGPPAENRLTRIDMPQELRNRLFTAEKFLNGDAQAKDPEEITPEPEPEPENDLVEMTTEYKQLEKESVHAEEMTHDARKVLDAIPTVVDYDNEAVVVGREHDDLIEQIDALVLQAGAKKARIIEINELKGSTVAKRKLAREELDYILDEQKTITRRMKKLKKEIQLALK